MSDTADARTEIADGAVRCLLLPMEGGHMLVPSTAVAEVTPWQPPEDDTPPAGAWLGVRRWRGRALPLLSLEALIGGPPAQPGRHARCAVLNALGRDPERAFYGLLIQGVPRFATVTAADFPDPGAGAAGPVARRVRWRDESVWIPDPDAVEGYLTMAQRSTASAG